MVYLSPPQLTGCNTLNCNKPRILEGDICSQTWTRALFSSHHLQERALDSLVGSQFQLTTQLGAAAQVEICLAEGRVDLSVFLLDTVSASPFKGIGRGVNVYIVNAPKAGSGRLKHDQRDQKVYGW